MTHMTDPSDYKHGNLYVYDQTTQTFDPFVPGKQSTSHWTREQFLERAAFIEKQIEKWSGTPDYLNVLNMEKYALNLAAEARYQETRLPSREQIIVSIASRLPPEPWAINISEDAADAIIAKCKP